MTRILAPSPEYDIDAPENADMSSSEREAFNQRMSANNLELLRQERNKLLAETDWMANSDVTMSESWRTYRQALRDITNTYSNTYDVVWPTKPGQT